MIDRCFVRLAVLDACLALAVIGEERNVASGCSSVIVGARTNANFLFKEQEEQEQFADAQEQC